MKMIFKVLLTCLLITLFYDRIDFIKFVSCQQQYDCGTKSPKDTWPWIGGLFADSNNDRYRCGVTLISKNFVITSATCVLQTNYRAKFEIVNLHFGSVLNNISYIQSRNSNLIYVHENFNYNNFTNNIALLKLDRPIDINDYVKPICLSNGGDINEDIDRRIGTIAGWIYNEDHKYFFREYKVPLVSIQECLTSHGWFTNYLDGQKFCGGYRNGTDYCTFHTGAGLMLPKSNSVNWQLYGIFGHALPNSKMQCDLFNYMVFTDVRKYTNWIKTKTTNEIIFPTDNTLNYANTRTKWHGIVYKYEDHNLHFRTAATLITTTHLITVATGIKNEIDNIKNLRVFFGKSSLKEFVGSHIQERHVNKILLHPNFDTDNIAVIYLKEAITITDYVSPIALPSPNAYKLNIVNAAVISWNNIKRNPSIGYTYMEIMSKMNCPSWTGNNNYCAKFVAGSENCEIRIGDEMVYEKDDKIYLRGMNVIGSSYCNGSKPFIDIFNYLEFITNVLLGIDVEYVARNALWDYSKCGSSTFSATPLIRNGVNTRPGQWPWHVAIYKSYGADPIFICSGSLLSKKFVLTAGHCVTKSNSRELANESDFVTYTGLHRLGVVNSNVQKHLVSKLYVHDNYNETIFYNDIGLMKLQRDVVFNDYVRPICLWEGENNINLLTQRYGTVTGWGLNENNRFSETLMMTNLPIVEFTTCLTSDRQFFSTYIHENNFCAGYRNGTTVCSGDSGGGLIFQRNNEPNVWQIRGIVSVGTTLAGTTLCHPKHYVIFTDVVKYIDWIKSKMESV